MGGVGSFHSPQSGIKENGSCSKTEDVLRPSFSPTSTPPATSGAAEAAGSGHNVEFSKRGKESKQLMIDL
jgi:hypothetical protein